MTQEGKHIPESDYYLDYLMTKKGNCDGYTDKQYELAKQAWKLYINTGGGGINNFKHYLRQNIIQNCLVTLDDINRAQKIFVHDVGHLKGAAPHAKHHVQCGKKKLKSHTKSFIKRMIFVST